MPRIFPAALIFWVIEKSFLLGVTSPEGWLCAKISANALSVITSAKTSLDGFLNINYNDIKNLISCLSKAVKFA